MEARMVFETFCRGLSIRIPGGEAPFVALPWQGKVMREMTGRDIVWKARKAGDTTLQLARDLWFASTVGGEVAVVVFDSPGDEMKKCVMASLRVMSRGMDIEPHPWGLVCPRGPIYVLSAREAPAKLRGHTINRLHIDEAAFCGRGTIGALIGHVPRDGEVAICSTENPNEHDGDNEAFRDMWADSHLNAGGAFKAHRMGGPGQ